jgi:hypothetical protein
MGQELETGKKDAAKTPTQKTCNLAWSEEFVNKSTFLCVLA